MGAAIPVIINHETQVQREWFEIMTNYYIINNKGLLLIDH